MENLDQKITVQIVLYEESFEIIKKCLINLKGLKVIIVDNKNDQELKKKITEEFIVEHYISNKKNIGYSKAHNQASSYVKTKYLLILNADCLINKSSIQILVNTIENDNQCGLVSPTTFDDNGNLTYNSGCYPEKGIKDNPIILEGDICTNTVLGSSMLISKELFNVLEGFDELFFLYFSDDELCKRINKKKFSIIQSFKATAIHIHGIPKVKNIFKKIFLREFNYTFDEMYYYHKYNIESKITKKNKKNKKNYLLKFITSLIFFKIKKSVFYLAKFIAIYKFHRSFKI